MFISSDTICALATSPGQGAISMIRLSGPQAISICNSFLSTKTWLKQIVIAYILEQLE